MPTTYHGFGTFYHGCSAPVRWEEAALFAKVRPDHDAVERITITVKRKSGLTGPDTSNE